MGVCLDSWCDDGVQKILRCTPKKLTKQKRADAIKIKEFFETEFNILSICLYNIWMTWGAPQMITGHAIISHYYEDLTWH